MNRTLILLLVPVLLVSCKQEFLERTPVVGATEANFYKTPEGFIVFTEAYHLKRGHCCQSGCKHCPYGFDKRTGRFTKKKNTP